MKLYFLVRWERQPYSNKPLNCVYMYTNKAKAIVKCNFYNKYQPEYKFTVEEAPRVYG